MLWEPAQSTQFQRDPPLRDSIFLCTANAPRDSRHTCVDYDGWWWRIGNTKRRGLWGAQASTTNLSSPLMSVVVKLVNYAAAPQPVNITLSGLDAGQQIATVSADILTNVDPLAENTLDNPTKVQPQRMSMNRQQLANEKHNLWSSSRSSGLPDDVPQYGWFRIGSDRQGLEVTLQPWSLVIVTVKFE
eukprot:COSAG02_NODE_1655_length_11483_cov_3.754327_2_plen_188_part_00